MFIAMPNNVAFCTAFQHLSLNNRFACVGFFCLCVLSKICRFCEMPHSFLIFKRFKAYLCSVLLHQPGEYDLCTDEEKNVVLWTGRRQIFTQPHFALLTFAGTVCGDLSKRQRKKNVRLFSLCNWIIIEEAIFIEGNKKKYELETVWNKRSNERKISLLVFFSLRRIFMLLSFALRNHFNTNPHWFMEAFSHFRLHFGAPRKSTMYQWVLAMRRFQVILWLLDICRRTVVYAVKCVETYAVLQRKRHRINASTREVIISDSGWKMKFESQIWARIRYLIGILPRKW